MIEDNDIQKITATEEIQCCYKMMCQLRPHLKEEQAFIEQIKRQFIEGYQLIAYQEEGNIKALAGFRFLECLAWGKVLYIDDLITDSETRKKGYAGKLLKWIIKQAKEKNCDQVHLDSGPQRHDAHRLYLNQGFKIVAHHFALELHS